MLFDINMLKYTQRKFLSINLPFSDTTLLATATKTVFAFQEYPDKSCE